MDIDSIDKQLYSLYSQINTLKCQQKELETYKKVYMLDKIKSSDIATMDIYKMLDMCSDNTKELVKSAIMCDLENQTKNLTQMQKGRRLR
jgi:hypothetical protein